jgi:K+-sensing histidine kinase KdpD
VAISNSGRVCATSCTTSINGFGCVSPRASPISILAGVLGVHFLEEQGDDLVAVVRPVATERGSTYVFVGTPDESRRREILGGSLLARMVRELPGIDIRVVTNRTDRVRLEP